MMNECPMCKAVKAIENHLKTSIQGDCRICNNTGKVNSKPKNYAKPRSAMSGIEWLEADQQNEWDLYVTERNNNDRG